MLESAFSGVIHVIHHAAGTPGGEANAWVASHSSGGAAARLALPAVGDLRQSLAVDADKEGFADDRAESKRGHVLYRAALPGLGGVWRLDADALLQRQKPTSPHPRGNASTVLAPEVPLDANFNPRDARLDEDRLHLVGGYERALAGGTWSTTLAFTHSKRHNTRGFLRELPEEGDEAVADGFRQEVELTDGYFDTHLAWGAGSPFSVVVGLDELYGRGEQDSENFEYEIDLDGGGAPNSHSLHVDERTDLEDSRNFLGAYASVDWRPIEPLQVTAGIRLNRTHEKREGGVEPSEDEEGGGAGEGEGEEGEEVSGSRNLTRTSGVLGASWRLLGTASDGVWLFGDYRKSFKPAALDFGPEVEGSEILEPETSNSVEVGLKGVQLDERLRWQATYFDMKLENLLVNVTRDGLPGLANGGRQRFKGYELEASFRLVPDLTWQAAYAHHDSKFEDFVQIFGDTPTQLRGKRLELAPEELWSTGVFWAPAIGLNAHAEVQSVGDRFLSRRNTVLAPSYTEWGAGLGWRFPAWELRLDGDNLGDERPPVSESELGDAQFYRLPARSVRLSAFLRF